MTQEVSAFCPLVCADLELFDLAVPETAPDAGLALVVRVHGEPIGDLMVRPGSFKSGSADALVELAFSAYRDQILRHFRSDGIIPAEGPVSDDDIVGGLLSYVQHCSRRLVPANAPRAAMVVCTIGTHPLLARSINAMLSQDYRGEFRVFVVDNLPSNGRATQVVADIADPRVELVSEPKPGLSFARNAGLAAALAGGYEILAYTDDDALVDPGWLRTKVAVFGEHPRVVAVTGLVVPGSLASKAEQLFEEGSGFNKGYRRQVWSDAEPDSTVWTLGPKGDGGPLFPFAAGLFGSGNSIAFRTQLLHRLGGFDEALGAGTLTAGGEDLDIFVRIIMAGGTIVYEPRAMVRHFHRDTFEALAKQMVGYGSGLSAFLFREFVFLPSARLALLKAVPGGLKRMFATDSEKNENRTTNYPPDLVFAERKGFIRGPWLYLRARRIANRLRENAPKASD